VNLYVGNLNFDTTEDDLRQAFAAHGTVTSARIITDRETGNSRGFGFVEMDDSQAGQSAMMALNGQELGGRTLTVNEARPREPRQDNNRNRRSW
jgi:cold-inducible RNA-binding protein